MLGGEVSNHLLNPAISTFVEVRFAKRPESCNLYRPNLLPPAFLPLLPRRYPLFFIDNCMITVKLLQFLYVMVTCSDLHCFGSLGTEVHLSAAGTLLGQASLILWVRTGIYGTAHLWRDCSTPVSQTKRLICTPKSVSRELHSRCLKNREDSRRLSTFQFL